MPKQPMTKEETAEMEKLMQLVERWIVAIVHSALPSSLVGEKGITPKQARDDLLKMFQEGK